MDQVYEVVKEIIPEIEARLKLDIEARLTRQIQARLRQQIEQEYRNRGCQCDQKQDSSQNLYERIAILEAQRRRWCQMETQYQSIIKQMTMQLKQAPQQPQVIPHSKEEASKPASLGHSIKQRKRQTTEMSELSSIHLPPAPTHMTAEHARSGQFEHSSSEQSEREQEIKEEDQPRHYRSVLSPPKAVDERNALFWDEDKKKRLLGLIMKK